MRKTIFLLLVIMPMIVTGQRADYKVIPLPASITMDTGNMFELKDGMSIGFKAGNAGVAQTAGFLRDYVEELTGLQLHVIPGGKHCPIELRLVKEKQEAGVADGIFNSRYTMDVGKHGVLIEAPTEEGLFRGVQTLRKSLPVVEKAEVVELPHVSISDEARFGYRGVHLDSSRHFWTVDVVKKYIDQLALHNCNQFHWHLTDDQGWRFEVKALPELAKEGSIREQTVIDRNTGLYDGTPYGGYYTQDELREVVRYAAERYINIIPEIDLPGHMQAALHVYPELGCTGGPYSVWQFWGVSEDVLCAGNPKTIDFLKTVLGELCDIFPSKLIHIGGDECPKVRWKNCAKCQSKATSLGLKDDGKHSIENQLQTWVNHEMESYLKSRGRDIIGWDEVLEGGLTDGGTVMSWRGIEGGIDAARQHHNVIMTPVDYCYIDYYQVKNNWNAPVAIGGYVPASKTYSFEPVPAELNEEEAKYILGPQVNLWCEYVAYPSHLFYMLLPRLDAISEVQWCKPERKDFEDFKQRLEHQKAVYDKLGVNYCRLIE